MDNSNLQDRNEQTSILLLEAIPVVNEPNRTDTVYEAEAIEEICEAEIVEDVCVTETKELAKEHCSCSTYQQGIDDFYQSQAENQKKKLDTIHEYLLYIMSPFVYEEDIDEFCTDLLKFATDHNYRPEVEWKRYKTVIDNVKVYQKIIQKYTTSTECCKGTKSLLYITYC